MPTVVVEKIAGLAKIRGGGAIAKSSSEVSMQAEDRVDVQRVRSDEKFLLRIALVLLQPGDVFVTGHVGVLAVGALPGPRRHPVRSVAEELRSAERIREQDEQFAAIGLLPKFQEAVLRVFELFVVVGERSQSHG